ncbi:MAG: sodium/substrate symporter small subunit [Lentimicrobium sp.]
MESSEKDYSFNLFKPVSRYGRANRDLIISLVLLWFIAIFGFQILLLVLEKPTPEEALVKFESVFENIKTGAGTIEEKQVFVNSMISVAGKSSVTPENRVLLRKGVSWGVYSLLTDSAGVLLSGYVNQLQTAREKLEKASDTEYIQLQAELKDTKASINSLANEASGVDPTNLKESILPYSLNAGQEELTAEEWTALAGVMKLYLIHNQSVLTDTKFLGFPFHYFYSSEFLLFLFVGISLFYSIRINQLQKKYGIKE